MGESNSKARPDIKLNADERGKVGKAAPGPAKPSAAEKRNFFQRFFNPFHGGSGSTPAPRGNPGPAPGKGH
jgi:hypothetical protein